MTPLEIAQQRYQQRMETQRATREVVVRWWRQLNPARLSQSWYEEVGPRVISAVMLGQRRAAEGATPYVQDVLTAARDEPAPRPEGRVNEQQFAGSASDGRPLDTLLYMPVVQSKQALAEGASLRKALERGRNSLVAMANTEVADAGRTADGAAIAAQPEFRWYVRVLTPPSCARCAVLAGRLYRWSVAFERHPQCDCIHLPTLRTPEGVLDPWADAKTDPREAVLSGGVRGLSKADLQAIRDGADVSQVVNAHRGMYAAAGKKFTREGTTRSGYARLFMPSGSPRLRPEEIYKQADSRTEAIRMLKQFGYLVDNL